MEGKSLQDIAQYYGVDDLPSAIIPHARIQKILHSHYYGEHLTQTSLNILQQHDLHALHRFIIGELDYENFHTLAINEQTIRVQAAKTAKIEEQIKRAEEDKKKHEEYSRAAAARLAQQNTPAYQAKLANQKLRAHYGINFFVDSQDFKRLMYILKKVDSRQRLDEQDVVWLLINDRFNDYFTIELRHAHHKLEAAFFADEFQKTRDPWAAINASSHYRKCECADKADELLRTIAIKQLSPKIQAALSTTHGGALRDLKRWDEALQLGELAHSLQHQDYRPCTLLGAIYMETGSYALGKEWYDKAIKRGATIDMVDREICMILARLPKEQRTKLEKFLLDEDSIRFAGLQRGRK